MNIHDTQILQKLINNELYLELLAAAQITGKPSRGIDTRTGATGRGLCYAILASVVNLYLDGGWKPSQRLTLRDKKLLKKMSFLHEGAILKG